MSDQKVHALHIVGLIIIAGERSQHRAQLLHARLASLEELVLWERARKVPLDLLHALCLRAELLEQSVLLLAFLILFQYNLGHINVFVLLLQAADLHDEHVLREPDDAMLASERVRLVLVTRAPQLELLVLS